ncbi:hypothetical protein E2C01_002554 [Portunus trituberculatus]|uniref:Uncharacterized protein n=1 Tax=Portunus trituberculatus TaxID=210409 RepID=A0A5B7CMJ1_PORTR|nr:hypothetical protein [Portunus trituberculatus]
MSDFRNVVQANRCDAEGLDVTHGSGEEVAVGVKGLRLKGRSKEGYWADRILACFRLLTGKQFSILLAKK